jgi:hypothetical protein
MLAALAVMCAVAAAGEKPKLLVLDVTSSDTSAATALTDAIAAELTRRGFFSVVTSNDIRAMLGLERQKQLTGCGDSCTTELAGSLGSQLVLQSNLSRLGDTYQLSLQMIDTVKAQPVARSTRLGKQPEALVEQLPYALAEATGTPLPSPPSRALPITFLAAGGAAVVVGGVMGITALSRDASLASDLDQGPTGAYKPLETYRQEASAIGSLRTASLISLVAGAALLVTGLVLLPKEGAVRVALIPTGAGAALAGVWP